MWCCFRPCFFFLRVVILLNEFSACGDAYSVLCYTTEFVIEILGLSVLSGIFLLHCSFVTFFVGISVKSVL